MVSFYLHDGDTVVDFSCGANAFVPLVKQEARRQGLSVSGRSFDIVTSQNLEDFIRCSWMDVSPGMPLCSLCSMSPATTNLLGMLDSLWYWAQPHGVQLKALEAL